LTRRASLRSIGVLLCILLIALGAARAQEVINGKAADGSLYQIITPKHWNHQLVLYAHGIVDPQAPIALPTDFTPFADALVTEGFAVAYSSFASNGFAIQDGVRDTDALRRTFAKKVGEPDKTFLVGLSLGSAVVIKLAEERSGHNRYDGVLSMCGLIGGSPLEVHYVGNGRVLFDYFFPGIIPGTLLNTPLLPYDPTSSTPNVGQAVAGALAVGFDPTLSPTLPTLQLADTVGLEAASPAEVLTGLIELLGFDVRYVNDVLDRTKQASPYGNRFEWYRGSLDDAKLNEKVERVAITEEGLDYLRDYYLPTGRIRIPTVTLHTTRDPLVPYWHEAIYEVRAEEHHRAGLLVEQSVERFGHCEFEAGEVEHALGGLIGWVDFGIKPVGGDVTGQ